MPITKYMYIEYYLYRASNFTPNLIVKLVLLTNILKRTVIPFAIQIDYIRVLHNID